MRASGPSVKEKTKLCRSSKKSKRATILAAIAVVMAHILNMTHAHNDTKNKSTVKPGKRGKPRQKHVLPPSKLLASCTSCGRPVHSWGFGLRVYTTLELFPVWCLHGPQLSTTFRHTSTVSPQPSTLNPQPSTLNPQPSTLNPQP